MMYKLCLERLDYEMGAFGDILIFTLFNFVFTFLQKSRSLKLIFKMFSVLSAEVSFLGDF